MKDERFILNLIIKMGNENFLLLYNKNLNEVSLTLKRHIVKVDAIKTVTNYMLTKDLGLSNEVIEKRAYFNRLENIRISYVNGLRKQIIPVIVQFKRCIELSVKPQNEIEIIYKKMLREFRDKYYAVSSSNYHNNLSTNMTQETKKVAERLIKVSYN